MFAASDDPHCAVLRDVHSVIELSLGNAQTGVELRAVIYDSLCCTARLQFDKSVADEVQAAGTPASALILLIDEVPEGVEIAVLVDEYDYAILNDVDDSRWDNVEQGLAALRSLLMASKDSNVSFRISHFIVTGVTRIARASHSAANNFVDFSSGALVGCVLGFSRSEIKRNFETKLARLKVNGSHDNAQKLLPLDMCSAAEENGRAKITVALDELAFWYDGYSFDGVSLLQPLSGLKGDQCSNITGNQMELITQSRWLGFSSHLGD